jgi:Tol biopolymer transport system component
MFFVRQAMLLAQRFDMKTDELVKNEVAVTDGVLLSDFGARPALSVSASGVVAYRRGRTTRQLVWFDRTGRRIGPPGGETNDSRWPAVSEKGSIAFQKTTDGQVWVIDAAASSATQFTFNRGGYFTPIWSPDGMWLAFSSPDGSVRRKRANGTGDEEILLPDASKPTLNDWSPDGKAILYRPSGPTADIQVLSLEGSRESRPYLANPAYTERLGRFSPKGRWVAYESNESGRFEIYVRPFPNASESQKKVSSDGGNFARWSADGRELYYLSPSGVLMAAPVHIDGEVFTFDPPHELFRTPIASTEMNDVVSPYDVSKDGRFVMRVPGENESSPITILLNWSPNKRK